MKVAAAVAKDVTEYASSFRGRFLHTPAADRLEVLADALIDVDAAGVIRRVLQPVDTGFDHAIDAARAAGRLTVAADGQGFLPGLVDLHIHAPQWPQLGQALDLPLEEWLQHYTFPLEARYENLGFADAVYRDLVRTLLDHGTTTAVYFGSLHTPATLRLAEICLEFGQRAWVGKVAMDKSDQCPDYYRDASAEAAVSDTAALIDGIRTLRGNGQRRVDAIITPRFIPACTDASLKGLGDLAQSTGCAVQTHCSESDWEHAHVFDRLGRSDTQALLDFGLLTRRSVLAHANFISDQDMDIIGHSGSGIAHCPLSNAYFANAVFPLRQALQKALHVGLGTDIAGGPSASILDSCRHAIISSRWRESGTDPGVAADDRGRPGSRIDCLQAFYLATVGGAEVLDCPVGRFAVGCQFDALLVDLSVPGYVDEVHADVASDGRRGDTCQGDGDEQRQFEQWIYGATRQNIQQVWVNGRRV